MSGSLNHISGVTLQKIKEKKGYKETTLNFGSNGIKLHGKLIMPISASNQNPVPGAILCHGFGADHKIMESNALLMVNKGIACFLFDIRGHGKSEGHLDGKFYEDMVDAWKVMVALPEVDNSRIALIGHSLGAFSVILASSRIDKPKAIVALACPFEVDSNGVRNPKYRIFPLARWFISLIGKFTIRCFGLKARVDWTNFLTSWTQIKLSSSLQQMDGCSKLFVFSEKDPISPFHKFKKLYEMAPGPKQKMVTRGSHVTAVEAELIRYEWIGWTVAALTRSEMVA